MGSRRRALKTLAAAGLLLALGGALTGSRCTAQEAATRQYIVGISGMV